MWFGTPSIDRCSRASLRRPGTRQRFAVLPLRNAFRRSFAPRLLAHGGTRPIHRTDALHVRRRPATRRLSTSATNTTLRAPPRRPRTSHDRVAGSTGSAAPIATGISRSVLRNANGSTLSRSLPAEISWARGLRAAKLQARRSSPRSLAGATSPRPSRLGHPLSQRMPADGWRSPLSSTTPKASPCKRHRTHRSRGAPPGPPRASPREEEHAQPHPRCLPSSVPPPGGRSRSPQAVPSLWNTRDAFSATKPARR